MQIVLAFDPSTCLIIYVILGHKPDKNKYYKSYCGTIFYQHEHTKPSPLLNKFGLSFHVQVDEREYNGRVTDVRLNGTYSAVLSGNKVVLQRIELDHQGSEAGGRGRVVPGGGGGVGPGPGPRRTFPERDDREHGDATAIALTEAFLVYSTEAGTVEFFCLSEWAPLAGVELKHTSPVKRLWPNYLGTRVVFVDSTSAGWLYSPASDKLTQVSGISGIDSGYRFHELMPDADRQESVSWLRTGRPRLNMM